jgi:hypothetical protein
VVRLNPDERTRELERRVAGGDRDAIAPLVAALRRAGEPVPYELLGYLFACESPGENLVTHHDGRTRRVKNLGWLRRQLHYVGGGVTGRMIPLIFIVRSLPGGRCYFRAHLDHDATRNLRLLYAGGPIGPPIHTTTFETVFESCHHLWDWLQSDLFVGVPLDWDGHVGSVDRPMHPSTYGHPSGSEGGPDVECHVCTRRYWSGDPDAHPDQPMCPTCYARHQGGVFAQNPDERARRSERAAAAGDLDAQARVIMDRVRRGEISMAAVCLADHFGSAAARLVECPINPALFPWLEVDRRDLVRWALTLQLELPGAGPGLGERPGEEVDFDQPLHLRRRPADERRAQLVGLVRGWLNRTGRVPAARVVRDKPTTGPNAVAYDAIRMIRARSDRSIHRLVLRVIDSYSLRSYQTFMDDVGMSRGERSPIWRLRKRDGSPLIERTPRGLRYDRGALRKAASRHASQLLAQSLLHEA